jgi:hypothetical protein
MENVRRKLLSVIIAAALLAAVPQLSPGAVVTVDSLADDDTGCTLRGAILAANADADQGGCVGDGAYGEDTIRFVPGLTGTIALTRDFPSVADNLTLEGPGAEFLTVDGGGSRTIFRIQSDGQSKQVRVSGLTVTGGYRWFGGCFYVHTSDTLDLSRSVVQGCTAAYGGGVAVWGCESFGKSGALARLDEVVVRENGAIHYSGGGIFANCGSVEVRRSAVVDNTAEGAGGGILIQNTGGTLLLEQTTVSGNSAKRDVGGVYAGEEASSLNHVTITGNRSDSDGDGIGHIGGVGWSQDKVLIANTIIAGNSEGAAGVSSPDCMGRFTTLGTNLIGDGTGCFLAGDGTGDLVGTTASPIDPLLGPLEDNGGFGPTHALLAGSPAVDAGAGDAVQDQRGCPRPADGDGDGAPAPDIGAYEVSAFGKSAPENAGTQVSLSPTLTWGEGCAERYEYCLDLTDDGACDSPWVSAGGATSVGLTGLANGATYFWQVRAVNGSAVTYADRGAWWSFTTIPPSITRGFRSAASQDGWVLESRENSGSGGRRDASSRTLLLGDDARRRQYRAILSFRTEDLPDDAVITGAVLKLRHASVRPARTNPIALLEGIMVELRRGWFGASPDLQPSDFKAPSDLVLGPFWPRRTGGWYQIRLDETGYAAVNRLADDGGLTQVLLRFARDDDDNARANSLGLFSGNAGRASRPVLSIEYYNP